MVWTCLAQPKHWFEILYEMLNFKDILTYFKVDNTWYFGEVIFMLMFVEIQEDSKEEGEYTGDVLD